MQSQPIIAVRGLESFGMFPAAEDGVHYCMHATPHLLLTHGERAKGMTWRLALSYEELASLDAGGEVEVTIDAVSTRVRHVHIDAATYHALMRHILRAGSFPTFGTPGEAQELAARGWANQPSHRQFDACSLAQVCSAVFRAKRAEDLAAGARRGDMIAALLGEEWTHEELPSGTRVAYVLNCPAGFFKEGQQPPSAFLPRAAFLHQFDLAPNPLTLRDMGHHRLKQVTGHAYDGSMPVLCYEQYLHWMCTLLLCFGTPWVPDGVFMSLYDQYYSRLLTFGPVELVRAMNAGGWKLLATKGDGSTANMQTRSADDGDAVDLNSSASEWAHGDHGAYENLDANTEAALRRRLMSALAAMGLKGLSDASWEKALRKALIKLDRDDAGAEDAIAALDRKGWGGSRRKTTRRKRGGGDDWGPYHEMIGAIEADLQQDDAANERRLPFEPPEAFSALAAGDGLLARLQLAMRRFAPTMDTLALAPFTDGRPEHRVFLLEAVDAASLPGLDVACKGGEDESPGDIRTAAQGFAVGFMQKFMPDELERLKHRLWPLRNLFIATYVFLNELYPPDDGAHMLHLQMWDYRDWQPVMSTAWTTHLGGLAVVEAGDSRDVTLYAARNFLLEEDARTVMQAQLAALTPVSAEVADNKTREGKIKNALAPDPGVHESAKERYDVAMQKYKALMARKKPNANAALDQKRTKATKKEASDEYEYDIHVSVLGACLRLRCALLRLELSPRPPPQTDVDAGGPLTRVDIFPDREMYVRTLVDLTPAENEPPPEDAAGGADLCEAAVRHWLRLGRAMPQPDGTSTTPTMLMMRDMLRFFLLHVYRLPGIGLLDHVTDIVMAGELSQTGLWMFILGMAESDAWDKYSVVALKTRTAGALASLKAVYLRREALKKKFDTNGKNAAEFIAYKQDVLMKLCCTCLPVIAKEAIGRVTLLDLYKPLWEGVEQDKTKKTNETTLPMLGMFLVRRFMLQYDIQTLKLFSLLNKRKQGGVAAECSHFDELWANQYSKGCRAHDQIGENEDIRKLSAKFGALRGLNQPTDENCLKSWADYSAPAWFDCKKLGRVNGWVAESFEAALGPDDTPQPLVVPVAVRNLMVSSGWADWFLTSYMKPIHATTGSARELTVDDLFAAPVVSEDVKSELRSVADAEDAWRLIVEISNSLMDDVQRVDEGRKRSAAASRLMGEAMDMSPPSKRSGSR